MRTCTRLWRSVRHASAKSHYGFRNSKQENLRRGKPRQVQHPIITRSRDVSVARCASDGAAALGQESPMSKHERRSPLTFGTASQNPPRERRDGSALAGRPPVQGDIGFVGLGHMGTAMAANLAATGRRVIAYVRRPDQIGKLEALRLKPTTDIGDLLDCEVVISMLPDDAAVREIVFGCKDAGRDGLAAGVSAYVERCQPILDILGQRTFVFGADPQDANLVKLLGNMMSATALEMLGEVVAVVRKRGLDPQPFIDIMTSTMFGGRAHKIYGDKIARQTYAPGFVLPLVLKDVRLALAEAERSGVPMPSVGVVRDRLITGIARGYGELDWTALGLIAAEEAGLYAVPSVTAD